MAREVTRASLACDHRYPQWITCAACFLGEPCPWRPWGELDRRRIIMEAVPAVVMMDNVRRFDMRRIGD